MIAPDTYTANLHASRARTYGHVPVFAEKSGRFAQNLSASGATEGTRATSATAAHFAAPVAEEDLGAGESGFLAFIKTAIDIINPLHHIPVIGAIYRHFTGDEISPVARVAGDALWGGPLGAMAGMADVVMEHATGKDTGATVMAMITGGKTASPDTPAPATQLAMAAHDIIWTDSAPSPHPAHTTRGTGGQQEPAALTMPSTTPVLSQEGFAPDMPAAEPEENRMPERIVNPQKPDQQKAPAVQAQNTAVPPALIATRMMEALEKYAAMKTDVPVRQ